MRKQEMREVEVKICDYCGAEAAHMDTCCMCGKEGCQRRGTDNRLMHWAYHIGEVYDYKTGKQGRGIVCKECSPATVTLDEFFAILTKD